MIVRETTSPSFLANDDLPVIAWLNYLIHPGLVTASNQDEDFPASNLTNPSTHLKWRETLNSPSIEEFIGMIVPFDASTSPITFLTVDYVAIARHNFGSLGCTLTLEGADDVSSPFTFTEIIQFTPVDDSPIIMQFAPRQLALMRLMMSATPGGTREAAVLYFGQIMTLERGVKADTTHVPINLGRNTNVFNGFSESGNFLGRIVRNTVNESKAEFMHFTADWYRANFDPFIINSQTHPFFWAWDPQDNPGDVGFSWMTKSPMPEFNPQTSRFNITLDMRAVA